MFTLELDLVITYIPPMEEHGRGIHLTREIQLPFAPYSGLHIFGRQIDHCQDPEGFMLKDVVWDIDREVFLGHTEIVSHDLPIAQIPAELKSWIDLGWSLGSYGDKYPDAMADDEEDTWESAGDIGVDEDFELMLRHPTLSPRQRPKELNLVMRAMVRAMAERYSALPNAYAMDKTKRFFTDDQLKDNVSKDANRWREAVREYIKMDWKQQEAWRQRVIQTHPRLDRLIERA